jgi:uncharacterized membrane protein YbaN (DUF454 family)
VCRLEFGPGEFDRPEMARRFAAAVTAATPAIRDRDRPHRDPQESWTTLTASAMGTEISIRHTRGDRPERAALRNTPAPARHAINASTGSPRPLDLALAGGSLMMALAGFILPGMPSPPFLLLTARHATRLSPKIDRLLRRRPWSAALLSRLEASESLVRLDLRSVLNMLPITALAAAVILLVHPPLPVMIGLEMGMMALVCFNATGPREAEETALAATAW